MILEYFSQGKGPFTGPWGRLAKSLHRVILTSMSWFSSLVKSTTEENYKSIIMYKRLMRDEHKGRNKWWPGGQRLLNFQRDSLGSNVDIPPGSLFFSICANHRLEETFHCEICWRFVSCLTFICMKQSDWFQVPSSSSFVRIRFCFAF